MYKGIDYEIAVLFAAFYISIVAMICLIDQCKRRFTRWSVKRKYRKSLENLRTSSTTSQ